MKIFIHGWLNLFLTILIAPLQYLSKRISFSFCEEWKDNDWLTNGSRYGDWAQFSERIHHPELDENRTSLHQPLSLVFASWCVAEADTRTRYKDRGRIPGAVYDRYCSEPLESALDQLARHLLCSQSFHYYRNQNIKHEPIWETDFCQSGFTLTHSSSCSTAVGLGQTR